MNKLYNFLQAIAKTILNPDFILEPRNREQRRKVKGKVKALRQTGNIKDLTIILISVCLFSVFVKG